MNEPPDPTSPMADAGMTCDECGGQLYGGQVIDHYELTRCYIEMAPDRRFANMVVPETLDVQFCSGRCLVRWVVAHIVPDVAADAPNE